MSAIATPPQNVVTTRAGKLRPVCETCGTRGRAVDPEPDSTIHLWNLATGWSVAPYPPDVVHPDGSHGDLFTCPNCERRLAAGERLTVDLARGANS